MSLSRMSFTPISRESGTKFPSGNMKKKARVLDYSSSSEDINSNSENESVEESIPDSGTGTGVNYCEEEEPPEKRRKNSEDEQKAKRTNKGTNDDCVDGGGGKEEGEYYVESILGMEYSAAEKKNKFLVKWLGYESEYNTWEPEEHLANCPDLVKDFMESMKQAEVKGKNAKQTKKKTRAKTAKSTKKTVQAKKRVVLKNKNGIEPSDSDELAKKKIEASDNKVVNIPYSTPTSSQNSTKDNVMGWLDENINLGLPCIITTQPGNIFYFRIIGSNGEVEWIMIDTRERVVENDYLKCLVTEDLTGKQPKLVYGATTSADGKKYCLVQFEGQGYVDVIPPDSLFASFPSFRQFFEMHCPHLFSKVA